MSPTKIEGLEWLQLNCESDHSLTRTNYKKFKQWLARCEDELCWAEVIDLTSTARSMVEKQRQEWLEND